VAGPLIGGYLTEHVGWHWIFYVNIPIGIVALAVIQRLLPTVKAKNATRNFDILGGVIFTIATTMFLIGLTFKGLTNDATHALYEWTDPQVGGLIIAGIIGYVLFVLAEARAKEPIVPLDLWRSRAYSASMVSIFFAAFAFFGAIVFLPRWFQVVQGFSPTNSGLAALPLVIGLIGSSIASGIMVARTGRYKLILVVAIATLGVATALMTQLTKDTPLPIVWFWMFLAGLGVGPTFSVFTIVIQNSVPFRQMGVATSNLTFFRQIGGSVALAFVGTIFATTFQNDFVPQLSQAGVSQGTLTQIEAALKSGLFDLGNVVGVGNLHDSIAKFAPPADVEAIVQGIFGAFSLAVAQTFYLGVIGAVVAVVAALAIKELPLRATNAAPAQQPAAQATARTAASVD
jgi:MFS family permease